jgi:hypothetical protein
VDWRRAGAYGACMGQQSGYSQAKAVVRLLLALGLAVLFVEIARDRYGMTQTETNVLALALLGGGLALWCLARLWRAR